MRLKIIGSNSAGNAYILESHNGTEALMIECGVRFDRIKKALDFNFTKVVGCLVSHEHQDHCKSVAHVLAAGIKVYASFGTHKAMQTDGSHAAVNLVPGMQTSIGRFKVLPFDSKHDCAEPIGFLINHPECGTVLFLTDSVYSPYYFKGLNNVIVEANYCQQILDARMIRKDSPAFLRDRVLTSHLSIENCKSLLRANDLTAVNNIVLIHLSDSNSNAARFKQEVEHVTGKTVHVADAGMTIEDFNVTPF